MDFNKALFGFIRVAFSIMIALLVLFAGIKICSICYDFGYRVFTEPAMTNGDGQDVLVQVEKGISAEELGQLLDCLLYTSDKAACCQFYRYTACHI